MEEARRDEGVPKPGPRGARDQRRAREGRERHPSRDGRCRGKASNVGPHGALRRGGHPHARIHTIAEVREIAAVGRTLTTTRTPDCRPIRLPPVAVDLAATPREYAFAPRYCEHTGQVLREAGFDEDEIAKLRTQGI